MTEDWNAVAKVVNQRVRDSGVSQRQIAQRSQVSQAVIREIQYNTVQRRRSARTLEALSSALDLHPGHLAAVLAGTPPPAHEPDADPREEPDAMELHLMSIYQRLDDIAATLNTHHQRPGEAPPCPPTTAAPAPPNRYEPGSSAANSAAS